MASELKPCPFCGSNRVSFRTTPDMDTNGQFHSISCNDCGAGSREKYAVETCPLFYEELRIAWNTRPAPAATDKGLKTIGFVPPMFVEGKGADYNDIFRSVSIAENYTAVVTRSQAEELLAAERAEKERLRGLLTSATYDLARANDECGSLTIDNAAKDARVEELIGTNIAVARRQEELANQLAETKGLLKTADDLAWQRGATIEALEAKLAAAEKALEPFANELSERHDKIFRLKPAPDSECVGFTQLTYGHFREARVVLGGKPS